MKTEKKNTLETPEIDYSKDHFPEKTAKAKEFLKKHPVPPHLLKR